MLAVFLLLPLAAAAVTNAAPTGRTALTLYMRDLGFVRESRRLDLHGSRDTVRIDDVPARIDFTSVRLVPESGKVTRLAYRYDVATVDGLLERARGSRVRVTMRGDRTVEGTLVSSDGEWVVLRESTGGVRTLARTAVEDIALASASPGTFTKPTLEAVVEGGKSGGTNAELSYLTGGLGWSAEHMLVRTGEATGTWSTNVSIDNTTGRTFDNVALKLVAGEPRRATPPMPMPYERGMAMAAKVESQSADLSEQSFSEYHLYTLDRPATVRDKESQQLSMLEPRKVKLTPRYLYRGQEGTVVHAQLELLNDEANGLGVPLPAGRVRVFEADAQGDLQFTGEPTITHTASGEKLTLDVGTAFDIVGERRETDNKRVSDREREYSVELKVRNRKKTAVTVIVQETLAGGDVEILTKSQDFTRKDANTIEFTVPIAAGKEATVTYSARVRY